MSTTRKGEFAYEPVSPEELAAHMKGKVWPEHKVIYWAEEHVSASFWVPNFVAQAIIEARSKAAMADRLAEALESAIEDVARHGITDEKYQPCGCGCGYTWDGKYRIPVSQWRAALAEYRLSPNEQPDSETSK